MTYTAEQTFKRELDAIVRAKCANCNPHLQECTHWCEFNRRIRELEALLGKGQ